MKAEVIDILSPQLPPAVCGVGDYTWLLASNWPTAVNFRFWVTKGGVASQKSLAGFEINEIAADEKRLVEALEAKGSTQVLLQYSAYGFDAKGWPHWLVNGLLQWRGRGSGRRLVVMFHELWSDFRWWNPNMLRQIGHRRDIHRLAAGADAVLSNTTDHCRILKEANSSLRVRFVPIPSTIPVYVVEAGRREGDVVLFGLPMARVRTLESHVELLRPHFRSGRLQRLIFAGKNCEGSLAERESKLLANLLPEERVVRMGRMPAEDLSRLLQEAEFGLSDQGSFGYSKSTTFMAYAAHGLNILSRHGGRDLARPFCWLTEPAELLQRGRDTELKLASDATALREWYQETADWNIVAGCVQQIFKSDPA